MKPVAKAGLIGELFGKKCLKKKIKKFVLIEMVLNTMVV